MAASAPNLSTFLANFKSVTSQNTLIPALWAWRMVSSGLPNDVIIKSQPSSQITSN